MKQISNWVFGSFFRTIGRLLVFVLLGVLIANFVDFGNLKDNFSITNLLGIEKIDALSLDGTLAQETAIFNTGVKQVQDEANDGNTHTKNIYFDYNYSNTTHSYMIIPLTGLQWQYSEIWTPATAEYIQQLNLNMYIGIKLIPTSGSWTTCELQNNLIVCPMLNMTTYQGIEIKFKATTQLTGYAFDINQWVWIYDKDTKAVENAINSQTQQQQQQHNETQSYLEDSNTTQAENDASDFFSDFQVQDHGGLSGIITAPLSTIQGLLNNTCTNLVLPLPFVNSNLTLPCMNSIYTEHFGAFFTIYQTIILAIISYRCLRSLFYDVRGFINPDDDRIEVMDL